MQNSTTHNLQRFAVFFVKKLRLGNPWNYKAPLLITFPYFIFLFSNYQSGQAFFAVLAACVVIIGVAGVGYLSNDLGDRKKDTLAGKENVLVNMPWATIAALFGIFFALTILPWFYLPFNKISAALLGSQFLLFFLYAVPPFRLKERGLPGIYADALYAHVIPAVLASYTFYVFTQYWMEDFGDYILVMASWQTIQGIRNILFHQLKDYESDKVSGTRTFVTLIGYEKTQRMVKNLALPLEGFSFIIVLLLMAFIWNHLFLLVFAGVYAVYVLISKQKELPKMDYRARAYIFLDDFYIQWLPLIVLGGLVKQSLVYIPVFILHVLLFRNGIKTFALNKVPNFNLKK